MNAVKVLNHYEAAALIGVTPATLRFWRCKGKGPRFIKLGQSKQAGVCYDPADIEAWKAERKFESTSAATVQYPATA
jgi:predicted DNA-binding transcriptional regulator AlpA